MYFLDELKNLRMYKKPFYLPLNMDNKRIGSCAFLLTPNIESTKRFLTNSIFVNRYYNSYYIERAVMYYINNESGNLESFEDDGYITERVSMYANGGKTIKLNMEGYEFDITEFSNTIKPSDFNKAAKEYDVKLPKELTVSVRRANLTMDYKNNTLIVASSKKYNKKAFVDYYSYCMFCMYSYIMKLCNPNIDERLMLSAALYECGVWSKNINKKWPFSATLKVITHGISLYMEKHKRKAFVNNVIKSSNGLHELEVPFKDAVYLVFDGLVGIFNEESVNEDYSTGVLALSENVIALFEDASQSEKIKKVLYSDRIKSNKELVLLYKAMKDENAYIKYTYIDLGLYKSKNMIFDLSSYNFSFMKNNVLKKSQGYNLYVEFMRRLIADPRFTVNGYTNNTVVIPVLDWFKECNSPDKLWMITESINPISCIYQSLKTDSSIIKNIFGDKTVLFIGTDSYFKMKFDSFDIHSGVPLFLSCLKKILLGSAIADDLEAKDSKDAIKIEIIDKVETSQNVKIDNVKDTVEDANEDINSRTKKDLVKAIDNVAKRNNNVDDAVDALDNEEHIKKILSDISVNPDGGSDISAARSSRLASVQKDFLDSEMDGKKVSDIITANSTTDISPVSVQVDSINEEWNNLNYIASVESYDLNSDISEIFSSFIDKSKPLAVISLDMEDTSTSEDSINTYTCKYEDSKGDRYTIKVDIPKILDKRYMKLRGNRKTIQTQLFLMPIVKTEEDTVQIISCYKKIYVRRFGTTSGKSNKSTDKLIKALTKFKYSDISIVNGDNSRVCSKYELPIDYIDISTIISSIETPKYKFYFNQDELRKNYTVDDNKGVPVGYDKSIKEVIYFIQQGEYMFFSYWLYLMISTNSDSNFNKNYNSAATSIRYCYSRASILSSDIPLIIVCAYSIGLEPTLKRAGIEYRILSDKRPTTSDAYDIVKFKDGWIEYKLDYASSLLMNGLKACDTESHSLEEINNKPMYLDFLDAFGGRIKADGLDNFYDCMIDPITKKTLEYYKLPTDYISALLHSNTLLADNKYVNHGNIRSTRRMRRIEQIADMLYKELSMAYGGYSTGIKHGRKVAFSMKQSAVIDAFLLNNTSSDQSILNPLGEYEDYNAVTPKGQSGMNSDRAYSLDKRSFDDSMINVLSTSTGFAGNVGITRQATIDANITGPRGYIFNDPDKDSNELNGIKALCMTEALTPFGTTRDDPMRTAMNFVQTSKHMMPTMNSDPLLITNGADEALPYLISNTFAYKSKFDGTIIELSDDYMIVEYNNGFKDYIDLSESIQKNSSSGFYISLKLDTDLKVGKKVKKNDILAYDKKSFSGSVGSTDNIAYNIGPMTKFAILNTDEGYEDSAIISEKLSEDLTSDVVLLSHGSGYIIPKEASIFNLVKKGQEIEEGDTLFVLQNAYDDEDSNALLRNHLTEDDISELGKNPVHSKVTGTVQDIIIKRTVELNELSPSLKKLVTTYEKSITIKKQHFINNGIDDVNHIIPDIGVLPATGKLKNSSDAIIIEIYLKYHDKFSIGDKVIYGAAVKGVDKDIFPVGMEPVSDYRPEEKINALLSIGSLNARMVTSVHIRGLINKGLIELTRQCKDILELPTDLDILNKK